MTAFPTVYCVSGVLPRCMSDLAKLFPDIDNHFVDNPSDLSRRITRIVNVFVRYSCVLVREKT